MVARITPNTSEASVALTKPRVSVSVVEPVAGVTRTIPLAQIDYIYMDVSATLDTTGRFKYFHEYVAVTDSARLLVSKGFADVYGLSDFSFKQVAKGLSDSVSFADAISKVLIFIRNFAETVGITERVALSITRPLIDSVGITDASSRTLYKALSDAFAMNDSFDIGDGAVWSFTKNISNVVLLSDSLSFGHNKTLSDSFAQTERLLFSVSKALTDAFGATDALSKSITTLKTDSFGATDSAVKTVQKSASADSITLSDTATLAATKGLTETVSATDAGYLYSQGYCDITYFAADYVGAYRTF